MKKIHKKKIYIASLIIMIGVILTTVYSEKSGSVGIALIALGGLLFISTLKRIHRSGGDTNKGKEE